MIRVLFDHQHLVTYGWAVLYGLLGLFLVACHASATDKRTVPASDPGTARPASVEPTTTPDVSATPTSVPLSDRQDAGAPARPTVTPPADLGKVAFLREGDIWVQAILTPEPRRLTTGGNYHTPRWSGSGRWLAFHADDQQTIGLVDTEGEQSYQLDSTGPFAWSPAGEQLAYFGDATTLHLFDPMTGQTTTLSLQPPERPAGEATRFAWSPDGSWLAYEWWEQGDDQVPTHNSLWKIPAGGGEATQLYAADLANEPGAILAGWGSAGNYILFWQHPGSASLLADGTSLHALPADGERPYPITVEHDQGEHEEQAIVLFHDSFLASAPRAIRGIERTAMIIGSGRATWENKRLGVAEIDTGVVELLTTGSVAVTTASWSPDGTRLAYAAMPPPGDTGSEQARLALLQRRIEIIDLAGKSRVLTDDPLLRDEWPLWSPDGGYILFVRMDDQDVPALWIVPVTGGEPWAVVEELSPAPTWHGYYGHIEWDELFDWWRPEP